MKVPDPDPGESWDDMNMQLFGLNGTANDSIPPMNGFVNNYVQQSKRHAKHPENPMHYYTSEQLPVLHYLAKQFAVSDQYFASAPCQTYPNRFFIHTGTADGYVNNKPLHFPYTMKTIFNSLSDAQVPWSIYHHGIPYELSLSQLWHELKHFKPIEQFESDAKNGKLPAYTFLNPRFFPDPSLRDLHEHSTSPLIWSLPTDQHPPGDVTLGEGLIAYVYNIIRNSPLWEKTLFIITYDEHGGSYDHVPPPLAVPPDEKPTQPFEFNRYGVRIPNVFISPWIKPGTILRVAPEGNLPHNGPPYPFDHTSIIATIRKCFNLKDKPLTNRVAVAPDFGDVLNLKKPENNPPPIEQPVYKFEHGDLDQMLDAPMNSFQEALYELARHLPSGGGHSKDSETFAKKIKEHIENLKNKIIEPGHKHSTSREALPFIQNKIKDFLGHE